MIRETGERKVEHLCKSLDYIKKVKVARVYAFHLQTAKNKGIVNKITQHSSAQQ